ncbi:hypothetical protein BVRB_025670, partial [Beta vulgaris subsp. vulgaris]
MGEASAPQVLFAM